MLPLAVALGLLAVAPAAADDVADRVVDELQKERAAAGLAPLERRPALDDIALERAKTLAALPHAERLDYDEPIGDLMHKANVPPFLAAAAHNDFVRGFKKPEVGFIKSWHEYPGSWDHVLDAEYTGIGAASLRAEDGFVIFVSVLVSDTPVPKDPRAIEQQIFEAVNEVRVRDGLPRLAEVPELSAVARRHSEDMLRRNFVAHVNPDGDDVAIRVERGGFRNYSKVGENIHMSRNAKDPVSFAVEQWMGSTGHRNTMLDASYARTGVGVAIAEDGSIYFTQVFLSPDRGR
jgi:uncharacterized protein YkwD